MSNIEVEQSMRQRALPHELLRGVTVGPKKLVASAVVGSVVVASAFLMVATAIAVAGDRGKAPPRASTAATQLEALLSRGRIAASRVTVQMGEILGIAAPGGGEVIRIHSAWNNAKHVQADAVTIQVGRLGVDLPSEQLVSTIDMTKGHSTWIKPTVAGAKWTYERDPAASATPTSLLGDLLASAGSRRVLRLASTRSHTTWRIKYTASDLQVLDALRNQIPATAKLNAKQRSLLSGERFSVDDLQITLDAKGRLTDLRLGGILTESRADAAARDQPYPDGGVKGVVLLHLAYTYGGSLAIIPPPARDVINPKRPIK